MWRVVVRLVSAVLSTGAWTGNRVYNNGTFRAAEVYDCLIVNNIGNWAGVFGGRFYGCTISGQIRRGRNR